MMTLPARLSAVVIFGVALAALRLQFDVSFALMGARSVAETLWRLAGYFTVLTNLGVALMMVGAATRAPPGPRLAGALTLAIVMVGVVYHLVLAQLWQPQGLAFWADQGLHTAVPVLVGVWWMGFAPKSPLDIWHPLRWVGVPLLYCIYALLRGQMTGTYPYPFIDMGLLGPGRTAVNVVVLALGFVLAGYGLLLLARVLPAQANPS